ncbi:MAG: mandelate racemase/muconate lactonizing enzyme family protein [Micromonosporaceae bacterium]
MRITDIVATPVAVPFRSPEVWAYGERKGLVSVLVEVSTDEGLVGIGEAPAYPSAAIVQAVLDTVRPLAIGEDPTLIERLMKRVHIVGTWHHVKATSPAIAAVEMACWDIVGKLCGQPLSTLFGGSVRDAVEYCYYVTGHSTSDIVAAGKAGVAAGYHTFYLKVGADDLGRDLERVAALRDAIGPQPALRVDANEAWSVAAATRAIEALNRHNLEFVEQPVSGRNLADMAYLRSRVSVPILANEASWTRYDQLDAIRHGAADALSVDNQMDGGLLNMKRSAGIAEAAALPVVKHSLGELGVATVAAAHVLVSTGNFLYPSQCYLPMLRDDVLAGGVTPTPGGRLTVPTAPGIGVELDSDRLARYAELYGKEGDSFGFHDPNALAPTPQLPKR